jgi:PIN domain nuclease of toxin-antitoxin system
VRLLLDTQVALWWLSASPRLSKTSRELMAGSPCAISVASIWEVALKHGLGKLPVSPLRFRDEMRSAGAVILSVSDEHVLATADLAVTHRDRLPKDFDPGDVHVTASTVFATGHEIRKADLVNSAQIGDDRPRRVRKMGRGRIFYESACRPPSRRLLPREPRPDLQANDTRARTP